MNNDAITVSYSTTATSTSGVGSYPITAVLSGPNIANYAVTTIPGTLTIRPANLVVTAFANSKTYGAAANDTGTITGAFSTTPDSSVKAGQPVTLSAVVSGPAGIVTFLDGSTALAALPVDVGSSVAGITLPALAFGTHTLAASFTPADALDYAPSMSTVPFTVTAGDPASLVATSGSGQSVATGTAFALPLVATLTDKYGDPVANANVTFTAPDSNGASVTFSNNGTGVTGSITVATNAQGQASVSVLANAKGGSYHVLAAVSGVNGTFSLTNLVTTSTALKANTVNLVYGQAALLTGTVAVPAGMSRATGTVTFMDGNTPLGTASLTDAVASLTSNALAIGSHAITVVYGGDTDFVASTSSALAET